MNRPINFPALLALWVVLISVGPAFASESSAVVGPVQLTLRVHKTTLKLLDQADTKLDSGALLRDTPLTGKNHDEVDWNKLDEAGMNKVLKDSERVTYSKASEPIWVQFEIKNVGPGPVVVTDAIFDEGSSFGASLKGNVKSSFGTFITVIGPDGKKVGWTDEAAPLYGCGNHNEFTERPLVGEEKRRVDAIVKSGRDAGLSAEQIQKRLDAHSAEKNERGRGAEEKSAYARRRKRLEPGQSLTSSSWTYGGVCGRRNPLPVPIAGFAELWNYKLTKPGRYRIRAVYDMRQTPNGGKSKRELQALGAVRVAVPEVVVEVKP